MKKSTPESLIVNACMRWLWLNGCFVWRQNTGAYKPEGSNRFIKYGFVGSADIVGVNPKGRFIGIECKAGNNKPTERQEYFGERVIENNGIYFVARSLDDLEAHKQELLT